MYTGDDFNYAELIAGDEQGYSDALLGIFDAIAPAASAALAQLGAVFELGLRRALPIGARGLQHARECVEPRLREERRAPRVADLALPDVRVPVHATVERLGAVVDVKQLQPRQPHQVIELLERGRVFVRG